VKLVLQKDTTFAISIIIHVGTLKIGDSAFKHPIYYIRHLETHLTLLTLWQHKIMLLDHIQS
jgi:hypothetical protein